MTRAISPRSAALGVGPASLGTLSEGGGLSGDVMAREILRRVGHHRKARFEKRGTRTHTDRNGRVRPRSLAFPLSYSDLNAMIGSTRAARRAGIQLAISATT